jgi:hypothetical protein
MNCLQSRLFGNWARFVTRTALRFTCLCGSKGGKLPKHTATTASALFPGHQSPMWLETIVVLVAALMVGNELTVAAFLHPTLYRLSDNLPNSSEK